MNIKEFIETSGMLEEYVLGHLSEQEAQGLECLAKTYPEIKQEIDVISESLGKYMAVYEKEPPAFLKERIFSQMTFDDPIEVVNENEEFEKENETEIAIVKVIPLWSKLALAASVLLAATTAWLYTSNNELKSTTLSMEERLTALESQNQGNSALLASFENPDVKVVKLNGVEAHPEGACIIHWNEKDNSVVLQVSDLPKPAAGKQYQLWVIGENGPEDMGLLDNDFENKILAMKPVNGKPSAFAITLEKEGGVPSPSLDELYVIGNV
ncbi:MAG: anti-sigma factor [Cytophagales bacterium]|nr:anti-sigma factor [Cytophagales bacterium]